MIRFVISSFQCKSDISYSNDYILSNLTSISFKLKPLSILKLTCQGCESIGFNANILLNSNNLVSPTVIIFHFICSCQIWDKNQCQSALKFISCAFILRIQVWFERETFSFNHLTWHSRMIWIMNPSDDCLKICVKMKLKMYVKIKLKMCVKMKVCVKLRWNYVW